MSISNWLLKKEGAHTQGQGELQRDRPLRTLLPWMLFLAYVLQCTWFLRTQSLTYDEPVHIAEGLDAWRHGRFEQYNDHPPLARLLCALPLLNEKWQIDVQQLEHGFHVPRITIDPEALAWRARAANVGLGMLLAWLLWSKARETFSEGAANVALALFVFSPTVIANFSVATTDGAMTLMTFATAIHLVRWRRYPSGGRSCLLGVILGLLLLSKFSSPPIFVAAILGMLLLRADGLHANPLNYNWARTMSAVLVASLVLWAGYFFHISHLTIRHGTLTATFPHWNHPIQKAVRTQVNLSVFIPAGEYFDGLRTVARHNSHGQPAFFLGQVSQTGGWRSYYPTVILLKWPVLVLLLFALTLFLCLRGTIPVPSNFLVLASFPAVYFGFAVFSRFNMGDRHILPIYPFVVLLAGGIWHAARRGGALKVLLVITIMLQAADSSRFAPNYLTYFNFFVRPEETYQLLSGSNMDWGQGLLALREYEREHPTEQGWLAYFGSVDPAVYGITSRALAEDARVEGTVIVGATNLSGEYLNNPKAYLWVQRYKRVAIVDHTLYVYRAGESQ
jgi:4-amino-4-deoxy-L-arabinose transferase-like glycosyltransferase